MNIKTIGLTVIILILGIALGIFYQMYMDSPTVKKVTWANNVTKSIENLSSKFSPAIIHGTVVSRGINQVTISSPDNSNLTISIVKGSLVYNLSDEEIKFDQIKKGDLIRIEITLNKNGDLEGNNITIVSSGS